MTKTRSVWFITRPERDPQFHSEAMKALQTATKNFTVKWSGNRDAHKKFEEVLGNTGWKRNNISNDGSGGRTWAAMLKTFSYCYTNEEGYLVPTEVGKKLLLDEKVFENIRKQILTLQIPNAYFLESGFRPKYEDDFEIRPARFLIRLVQHPKLQHYITKEEITYFALTAKRDDNLEDVVETILAFRNAMEEDKQLTRIDIAASKDHRQRSDCGARDYWTANADVAHTFMLLCEYTELVEYERGTSAKLFIRSEKLSASLETLALFETRYPFNYRYKYSIERLAITNGLDVDRYKASRMGNIKPASNAGKFRLKVEQLLGDKLLTSTEEEIEKLLVENFGEQMGKKAFAEVVLPQKKWANIPEEFVNKYLGEMTDREFETYTVTLLRQFGFDEVIYKPKIPGISTEIEILVKYGNNFGIIDTKYYGNKFSLSQNLASYMANEYIVNYQDYRNWNLSFFGYVTSERFTGEKKLSKITSMVRENGHSVEAGFLVERKTLLAFLDYCIENDLSPEERLNIFLKNIKDEGITKFDVSY